MSKIKSMGDGFVAEEDETERQPLVLLVGRLDLAKDHYQMAMSVHRWAKPNIDLVHRARLE